MSGPDQPEAPVSPRLHHGRLAIEQRILGLLAALGLIDLGLGQAWISLVLEPEQLAALGEVSVAASLGALSLAALFAVLIHATVRLPAARWGSEARKDTPSPWPLALVGFPSLVLWPVLTMRDRAARESTIDGEEVELGFRQLLTYPRQVAGAFLLWLTGATIVELVVIGQVTGAAPNDLLLLGGSWLATLLPLGTIVSSRVRAMLAPEYVSARRPHPLALPTRRSLRLRLGVPSALALIAAVAAPVLAGAAWSQKLVLLEQRVAAREQGEHALELAARDPGQLADHLEALPHLTMAGPGAPADATFPVEAMEAEGFVDLDADGHAEAWVGHDRDRHVLVQMPRPASTSGWLILCTMALGLVAGLASLSLLMADVERDLVRSTRHVAAVAVGEVPEPMALVTFATRELRSLVAAMDRLVGRITDANIAKYVLIEKAQEADRLKSQFLANMSHDLRSPLNSVIGFSELLTTGIEGELQPDQLDQVRTIHRVGKALLQQIDDILDTAKLEAGRMELHPEPTPPATLISRAIERARARLSAELEFETQVDAGLPPAFVDRYRTVQAIENAVVFAGEGVANGCIRLECSAKRSKDGAGVIKILVFSPRSLDSTAALEQARRGFVRVPGQPGLGLGVPIASNILELQGGSLGMRDVQRGEVIRERAVTVSSTDGDWGLPQPDDRFAVVLELRMPALAARKKLRLRSR